jgi:6-phosphogluconolactonase (cycloisomerase 2 family)
MLAAEIVLAPATSTEAARLYVSNRNDPHAGGDTIAVFSLATSTTPPKFLGEVRTGLKHVRGMALDPTGHYLIAGGADGGGAKIYERAPDSHWLNEIAHTELEAPTAFLWV